MKIFILTIFAMIGAIFLPTLAFAETKVINGCEVVQASNGNYFYKVDGACQFDRTGLSAIGDGKAKWLEAKEAEEAAAEEAAAS